MATWSAQSKNSANWTNQNVAALTAAPGQGMGLLLALTYSGGQAMPGTITWTGQSKNTASWSAQTKN